MCLVWSVRRNSAVYYYEMVNSVILQSNWSFGPELVVLHTILLMFSKLSVHAWSYALKTSTPTPSMHQKTYWTRKFHVQIQQLLTKLLVE